MLFITAWHKIKSIYLVVKLYLTFTFQHLYINGFLHATYNNRKYETLTNNSYHFYNYLYYIIWILQYAICYCNKSARESLRKFSVFASNEGKLISTNNLWILYSMIFKFKFKKHFFFFNFYKENFATIQYVIYFFFLVRVLHYLFWQFVNYNKVYMTRSS